MGAKIFKNLLVILSFTALTAPWLAVIAVAKPLEPHPDWEHWAAGTLWGAELSLENAYSKVYFGAKTGAEHVYLLPPAPVPPWIKLSLVQGGTEYAEITRTQGTPPQSYSWYVMMQSSAAQTGLTLSADLESDNYWFVPHDHSVVLENATAGIGPWNLREENGSISLAAWVSKYATLYVDNHVNLTISPDSQSGDYGDNVSFTVTVSNTGGYNDTYSLDVDAGGLSYDISPSSLSINAGDNGIATLTVTLGADTKVITVTADGTYADDNASCTVTATAAKQYDLTANVDPPGSGSVTLDPAGGTYEEGTDVTATANPTSGYEFDHWSGDASGTSTSVTVTMNSEKSITAHFRSTGEGEAREEFPWTWIGAGIVIVIVIIVAVVAMTRRR